MSLTRALKVTVLSAALLLPALASAAQSDDRLRALLPAVREADAAAAAVGPKVWTGFDFQKQPLVLFDPATRRALLVHFQTLPEGFTAADAAVAGSGLGALPEGTALYSGAALPFGGRLAGWLDATLLESASTAEARRLLYREAFRVYAQFAGIPPGPGLPQGGYPAADATNSGMLRAESALCGRLMRATAQEAPALAAALLALRSRRQGRLPSEVAAFEWKREASDGLAEYAGFVAASTLDRGAAFSALDKNLAGTSQPGKAADPTRFAATGGALGAGFDTAMPDWKSFFESGDRSSFEPLLRALMGDASPADTASLDIDGMVAQEARALEQAAARRAELLAAIEQAKGLVLVLDLSTALTFPGVKWGSRYDQKTMVQIDQEQVLHTYFKLTGAGVLEYVSSKPTLYRIKKSVLAGFAQDAVPFVSVDGQPATFSKETPSLTGKVEVRGAEFILTVERAKADWDAAARRLTITPIAPGS